MSRTNAPADADPRSDRLPTDDGSLKISEAFLASGHHRRRCRRCGRRRALRGGTIRFQPNASSHGVPSGGPFDDSLLPDSDTDASVAITIDVMRLLAHPIAVETSAATLIPSEASR